MQIAKFQATCPYEIGDILFIEGPGEQECIRITDILAVHSVKNGTVSFEADVELVAGGRERRMSLDNKDGFIKKMIKNRDAEARRDEWEENSDGKNE